MNKNYSVGIFDFPLIHLKVRHWEDKKSQIIALKDEKNLKHVEQENIITDYQSSNTNNYSKKLEEILEQELNEIYKILNLKDYYIRNSWIEVAEHNMDHKVHNHGALGMSCVCYLDFDPKVHTATHFMSPYGDFETGTTQVFVPQKIEEGSLICFPSMLNHFTLPNSSDIPRGICSFNLNKQPDKVYGYMK